MLRAYVHTCYKFLARYTAIGDSNANLSLLSMGNLVCASHLSEAARSAPYRFVDKVFFSTFSGRLRRDFHFSTRWQNVIV